MTKAPSRIPAAPFKMRIASALVKTVGDAARRRDGTVNRRLLSLIDFKASPNATPVNGVSTSDHTVDPTRNLNVRLFSPSSSPPPVAVIVYFHGGGFLMSSAFSRPFDALCRRFSRQIPAFVVSVDYRLAPEHRCPAAYDDGISVLRWLDSGDLIADLSAVFIAGDSAGGNIAHHVARTALTSAFKRLSVAGLVTIQPFFGGEADTESEKRLEGMPFGSRERHKWLWRSFLPVGSGLDHEAANVFGPGSASASEDWAGFPATLVVTGGLDPLQDRQRWYCDGLKGVGVGVGVGVVEYPKAPHGFHCFLDLPEAGQLLDDVAGFVRRRSESERSDE